jgi:hypothetical protein
MREAGRQAACAVCGTRFRVRSATNRFCSGACYGRYRASSVEITAALRRRRDYFATEVELRRLYLDEQLTQAEIGARYGISQKKVWGLMRFYGITTRPQVKRSQRGALNAYWKGGRVRMGEYRFLTAPDHPNARNGRYIAEHVFVATAAAGRPLRKGEIVHHLDGDKEHNSPQNLLITGHVEHGALHRQLETIALALYRAGLVDFDHEARRYRVSDVLRRLTD